MTSVKVCRYQSDQQIIATAMVLQIKNPCTEPTGDDTFEWRSQFGDVKTNTLYASNANYGYTFDIYELDNSFNMEINGQKLATKATKQAGKGNIGFAVAITDRRIDQGWLAVAGRNDVASP